MIHLLFYTFLMPQWTIQECLIAPTESMGTKSSTKEHKYASCAVITKSKNYPGVLLSSNEVIFLANPGNHTINNVCCKGPPHQPVKCRKPWNYDETEGFALITLSNRLHNYDLIINHTSADLKRCKVIGLRHKDYFAKILIKRSMLEVQCKCQQLPKQCNEGDAVICSDRLLGMVLADEHSTSVFELEHARELFGEYAEAPYASFKADNESQSAYWAILRSASMPKSNLICAVALMLLYMT